MDQVSQLTLEICNEDVISLFVHKLSILGWEARKNLVHSWSILLKQKVDSVFCCVRYMENHLELLDFLVVCYDNKEIALNCGNVLRECIKFPTLAKNVSQDLLTKHPPAVSEFPTTHYNEQGIPIPVLSDLKYDEQRKQGG
ncbi:Mo25 family protein [Forsythia ovata]|uniref:Mo25 family protein n=1 Tax=Forsythia ovata TaxID=205694 RepID=A0ABD1P662_9LAMI